MASFVVLGSSSTALALGRRIRGMGARAVLVDTGPEPAGIATRSRVWAERHRGATSAETLGVILGLGETRVGHKPFLLGTGDEDLELIAEHRDELDARFDVLHPSSDALRTCLDKVRFHRFCDAHAVPAPAWFVCRATAEEVRRNVAVSALPLVARVARRSHGRRKFPKMVRLDKAEDIETLIAQMAGALGPEDELLFTESLLHKGLVRYSVAFCRARGTCLTFEAVKERPTAGSGDVGTYVTVTRAPEPRAIAERAAKALDYHGMGEMEVFQDRATGRYYSIEINARPWLQLGMESLAGRDFLGFLSGTSSGVVGDPQPGAAWVDLLGDLYWRHSRTARRSGNASPAQGYLRSLTRARAFKLFSAVDPGPSLFEATEWIRRVLGRRDR